MALLIFSAANSSSQPAQILPRRVDQAIFGSAIAEETKPYRAEA